MVTLCDGEDSVSAVAADVTARGMASLPAAAPARDCACRRMFAYSCIYKFLVERILHRSAWRITSLETEHEGGAVAAEQLLGTRLGAFPGRPNALNQVAAFGGDLEARAALVLVVGNFLDPSMLEHDPEIARQRRGIEAQPLAELGATHRAGLRHRDQQAELARLQPGRAHLRVIDAGQLPADLAPPAKQALARNLFGNGLADKRLTLRSRHGYLHGLYLYMQ